MEVVVTVRFENNDYEALFLPCPDTTNGYGMKLLICSNTIGILLPQLNLFTSPNFVPQSQFQDLHLVSTLAPYYDIYARVEAEGTLHNRDRVDSSDTTAAHRGEPRSESSSLSTRPSDATMQPSSSAASGGAEAVHQHPLHISAAMCAELPHLLYDLRTAAQIKQKKVNNKAQNCALALMYAAQRGSNTQLAYLLGQYTFCFRVLFTFDHIANLLVQTLKALRRLVVKVENIAEVQNGEEEFQADRAWGQVRQLMHTNKSGFAHPPELDANSDSGMENDSQSTTDAKVRKYATRLYEAAAQGLGTNGK